MTYERDDGSIGSKITWSIYSLIQTIDIAWNFSTTIVREYCRHDPFVHAMSTVCLSGHGIGRVMPVGWPEVMDLRPIFGLPKHTSREADAGLV